MTAPVRYGKHDQIHAGTPCILCGRLAACMVVDHCHAHMWVRGPVCQGCNWVMAYIDRRELPDFAISKGGEYLAALVSYAARCPDCGRFGIADLDRPNGRERLDTAILVRMTSALKGEIAAYANRREIPEAAAARELMRAALDSAGRRESRREGE